MNDFTRTDRQEKSDPSSDIPSTEKLNTFFENVRNGTYCKGYGPYEAYFIGYSKKFDVFHLSLVPDSYCHDLPYATMAIQVDSKGREIKKNFVTDDQMMSRALQNGKLDDFILHKSLYGNDSFEKERSGDSDIIDLTDSYKQYLVSKELKNLEILVGHEPPEY